MQILLLSHQDDPVTNALFECLSIENHSVALVTPEQLVFARSWKHIISSDGECQTEISLQNGVIIHSDNLKCAFNRIRFFTMPHFFNVTDRTYAETEMFALYASFLRSIHPVLLNPMETRDLVIDDENILLIKSQAAKAGLPTVDFHFTTSPKWQRSTSLVAVANNKKSPYSFYKKSPHLLWENKPVLFVEPVEKTLTIMMVGETIIGEIPGELKTPLMNFSRQFNSCFIEFHFSITPAGYKLASINNFPKHADKRTIEALARLIKQKSEEKNDTNNRHPI